MSGDPYVERGRNQVLYNYGPEKVFYHERSGRIEKVLSLRQDPRADQVRVNKDQLRDRIRRAIHGHGASELDPELLDHTPVNVVRPDWVVSMPYPLAYYCQSCGHLYVVEDADQFKRPEDAVAALDNVVPSDRRCTCEASGSPCRGRVVQYDVLTTHNCGEEVFAPKTWYLGRCRDHGADHLHWYRQGSERASRWRVSCEATGCTYEAAAHRAFYGEHRDCQAPDLAADNANVRADVYTGPFMKATHYIARVVNLLNSDSRLPSPVPGTRDALVFATGVLRDGASFRAYRPYEGHEHWLNTYQGPEPGDADDRVTSAEVTALRSALEQARENNPEAVAGIEQTLDKLEAQAQTSSDDGPGLPASRVEDLTSDPLYTRQVRDTALYMDSSRSHGFDDFLQRGADDDVYANQLQQAKGHMDPLHIHDIRYLDRVPVTTALVGFARGSHDPSETRLNFFHRMRGDGVNVYANETHTEGIWVQLDPSRTLEWLSARHGVDVGVTGDFSTDLLELQERFQGDAVHMFGEIDDPWTASHFGLLHTISHLLIKAAGRVSGLEQEGVSEELVPYTNGFVVYANHSGEFTLGGLQLMMEHHMGSVLGRLREDAHKCVMNPVCEDDRGGSCHGCVQIGEVSCAHYNRTLSRNLLVDPGGFWWRE